MNYFNLERKYKGENIKTLKLYYIKENLLWK